MTTFSAPQPSLKPGEHAARMRTTLPIIRTHEGIGRQPRPSRQTGGHRYGQNAVRHLTSIRLCRDFGFTSDRVRGFAALSADLRRDVTGSRNIGRAFPYVSRLSAKSGSRLSARHTREFQPPTHVVQTFPKPLRSDS